VERHVLRRAGYVAGGLVVIAGAVIVLRNTDTPSSQKAPPPPPSVQTTVREYADAGILAPQPGTKPATPADVRLIPGSHRLQATWTKSPEAAGYEVRLGDKTKLVTDNAVQFNGLDDNTEYELQVRAMDSFGQRSDTATQRSRPGGKTPDESAYSLIDHFDGPTVPDSTRWRLANNAACARMSRGVGEDSKHLVISAACGTDSVALRSRTPLQLAPNGPELGRVMIETDAPGDSGEMTVDLVPGPADLIETSPRGGIPPGTIRLKVTPDSVGAAGYVAIPIDRLHDGISTRWEFVVDVDGIEVRRNGSLLGQIPVVPQWTEATPLFEFTGPPNGLNFVTIDAIGLSSSRTPVYVPPPRITTTAPTTAVTTPVPGQLGGQLRMTIRSSYGQDLPGPFTVQVAGQTFPVRPAVAGQPFESGLRYPVVTDLPATVLLTSGRSELPIQVHSADPDLSPQVQHADIELVPDPAHPVAAKEPPMEPVQRPRPVLGSVTAALLDASGSKIENGRASPSGRVVLEIVMAGGTDMASLAGIEVWVDNKRIAGIPANRDGPGVAGKWRLALNTTSFQPGVRDVEVKAISTDGVTSPQLTSLTWSVPAS
jgi:hypothetical protein